MPWPLLCRAVLWVTLVVVAPLACGCGVKKYQASNVSSVDPGGAQGATLTFDENVRIVSVDGHSLENVPSEIDPRGVDPVRRVVRLAPGTHRVVAGMGPYLVTEFHGGGYETHYLIPGSKENEEVEFVARAGQKYRMRLKKQHHLFKLKNWSVQIQDSNLRYVSKSVARVPHSAPNP